LSRRRYTKKGSSMLVLVLVLVLVLGVLVKSAKNNFMAQHV
jgi:hypothetical protein